MHLIKGEPAPTLLRAVRQLRGDLLVLGTVARTGVSGFLIGNTAETVLNEVNCSVLAIKPDGFVSPVRLPAVDAPRSMILDITTGAYGEVRSGEPPLLAR
jgi:hypothetical protein